MRPRPEIIAHRGASLERPENTLPAFLRALELGADAVELDVHRTRDGHVVVNHDAVVRRADGTESPVASLDLADLPRRDAGPGDSIPTLAEVLDVLGGRVTVYVEIKASGIAASVVEVIRRSPAPARCPVHSFDHRTVRDARSLAPELAGGVLLASYLLEPAAALRAADARDYWIERQFADGALVEAIHAAGGRVVAWTVSDEDEALRLAAEEVDGICTDRVGAMRNLFAPESRRT